MERAPLTAGDLKKGKNKSKRGGEVLRFKFMKEFSVRDLGWWDVTPCNLVRMYRDFKSNYSLSFMILYGKLQTFNPLAPEFSLKF